MRAAEKKSAPIRRGAAAATAVANKNTSVMADVGLASLVADISDPANWQGMRWPPDACERAVFRSGTSVTIRKLGSGQSCTVVLVSTDTQCVALKYMSSSCAAEEMEFIQSELQTEAAILMQLERDMGDEDAKRHIGLYLGCVNLSRRRYNYVLFLEPYTHYVQIHQLVCGNVRLGEEPQFGATWLECVRQALFQIFCTLAQLQAAYPAFRHNDVLDTNVLVGCFEPAPGEEVPYAVGGAHFSLRDLRVDVKLVDFANAYGAGLRNPQVEGGDYDSFDITPDMCPLYDVQLLFICLMLRIRATANVEGQLTESPYGAQLLSFITDVIPAQYLEKNSGDGRYKLVANTSRLTMYGQRCIQVDPAVRYRTPAAALLHPFFIPYFRGFDMGVSVSVRVTDVGGDGDVDVEMMCDEVMNADGSVSVSASASASESVAREQKQEQKQKQEAPSQLDLAPVPVAGALELWNAFSIMPMLA
jgi:hypothetical protein